MLTTLIHVASRTADVCRFPCGSRRIIPSGMENKARAWFALTLPICKKDGISSRFAMRAVHPLHLKFSMANGAVIITTAGLLIHKQVIPGLRIHRHQCNPCKNQGEGQSDHYPIEPGKHVCISLLNSYMRMCMYM